MSKLYLNRKLKTIEVNDQFEIWKGGSQNRNIKIIAVNVIILFVLVFIA